MSDSEDLARRATAWGGWDLSDRQLELLVRYGVWLVEEAIPAGGLGTREAARLWSRHLADSLTFAAGWAEAPTEILDVGSGVGLPGIPLAVLWPETQLTLLDRGGRRMRLLHRVVRILALTNTKVAQGDVFAVADEWEGITFRGAVSAPEAVGLTGRLLQAGGTAVLGLSRRDSPPTRTPELMGVAQALGLEAEVRRVPDKVLDGPSWLLIMRS